MMFSEIFTHLGQLSSLIRDVKEIDVKFLPQRAKNCLYAVEGAVNIEEREVIIQIAFSKCFPYELPKIFMKDPCSLGFLPHNEKDGYLCFVDSEGLNLDVYNPCYIVEESIERTINLLTKGYNNDLVDDFVNDFELYWAQQQKTEEIYLQFNPVKQIQTFEVLVNQKSKLNIAVDKSERTVLDGLGNIFKIESWEDFSRVRGIYIPLRYKSTIAPPKFDSTVQFQDIKELVYGNLSSSNKSRLKEILSRHRVKKDSIHFIMLSIPRPAGGEVLIALKLYNFKAKGCSIKSSLTYKHPLAKNVTNFEIVPLIVQRQNINHLIMRTGGENDFENKKVAIIGVGAVGSRIAVEMIRAGVTEMTLIDQDVISTDNVFRHELGMDKLFYWDVEKNLRRIPKSMALKLELEKKYPMVSLKYLYQDVLDIDTRELLEYQLIIVAIGSTPVERYLNKVFHSHASGPPVIYTWTEPLGIGGHALVTLNKTKRGCFECLYTSKEATTTLKNSASFTAPNQVFSKSITGCGGTFSPYGSLDALQTAVLASRLAISVLKGDEEANPLLSWKGDSTSFVKQGYKLSKRFELSQERLDKVRYLYQHKGCKVCR